MNARSLVGLPLRVGADIASRTTLAVTDVVLASRVAGEVVDRIVASALVERAVERLLATDALEQVMRSAQEAAVAQRLIDSELLDEFIDRLPVRTRFIQRIAE